MNCRRTILTLSITFRVSDYNEVEAHNTDLQSELFARDRYAIAIVIIIEWVDILEE